MKRFTEWLVRIRIKDWQKTHLQEVRTRYGVLGGWASIWLNIILSLVKALLGIVTGSISLIADAIHSLSDAGTSAVIVISFRAAEKPADDDHPFGHGRMEAVATLIISMLLIVVGFELGKSAFERLLHPKMFEFSWLAVIIIIVTIILKEALGQFARELGLKIDSSALEADFWHHRIDAISSVLVIAAFIGQRFGLGWIDGAIGILIAATVIYTGYKIARDGIDELLGKPPSPKLIQQIKEVVTEIPDILDVHDLIVNQYGTVKVISMHISVPDTLSLKYGHSLSEAAAEKVNQRFNTYTTVHLDPVTCGDKDFSVVERFIRSVLEEMQKDISFYDLRVEGPRKEKSVILELRADSTMPESEQKTFCRILKKKILENNPKVRQVEINIGPKFVY